MVFLDIRNCRQPEKECIRMNRRQFVSIPCAVALGGGKALGPIPASAPKRVLMKLGCQSGSDEARLKEMARCGIKNICGYAKVTGDRLYATVEELLQLRESAGKYGISVDMLAPPFLPSSHINRERNPAIMLGQSPQRDRDIESIQMMIKNCAAAGIPSIKYNMSILGVLRNQRVPGRGDSTYTGWKLEAAKPDPPLTRAGRVSDDQAWERITYFLERVIPVAEEYKVRMACHPQDPGVPPEGYQGISRVLGTVEGLKKFISIREGPYHGLNFCQGTISEDLEDPGKEIFDVIRYFGTRKKIFNVHFRNIRGHRDDFIEVFPDEGDVDFVKAIQVYKEVEYPYMLMPDHIPRSPSDPGGRLGFAFCYGYIRALIQAADHLE